MSFSHSMATLALLLLLASYVKAQASLFDIRKYGVVPNGDITMVRSNQVLTIENIILYVKRIIKKVSCIFLLIFLILLFGLFFANRLDRCMSINDSTQSCGS